MIRFIFEERGGLHVIDLAKTLQQLRVAEEVVQRVAAEGKPVLFVGTKKQAKEVVREAADGCDEHFICERWLGGTLTNQVTIRQSVTKLEDIEKDIAAGQERLTKKELVTLSKLQAKLEANLSGIRGMKRLPGLVVVVDPDKEHIAVSEANKLGIPVMALIDTNCDPDPIDYPIACNDDSLKSIKLIIDCLADVIRAQKSKRKVDIEKELKESA
jgi:small subunit ribosomal protein S2